AVDVLSPRADEVARGAELLHAIVEVVGDVHVPGRVGCHVDWEVELAPERRRGVAPRLAVRRNRADLEPGSAAGVDVLAPRAQEIPRGVELLDPVIADIGDVDAPRRRIRCDPDGEVELPDEAAVAPGLTVRGDRADLEPGPAAGDDV